MANSILKIVTVLITLTSLVLTANIAVPPADGVGVPEFKDAAIGVLQFKGPIHGIYAELNGTVDEIYDKFSEMYPEVVANAALPAPYEPDLSDFPTHALTARNKNDYTISPACPYLVSYAWDIVFKCTNTRTQLTGGQEFDTDRYNVIIRDHSCP